MKTFPNFMKSSANKIDSSQQNTTDIEGYYFQGADNTQIAFWECSSDKVSDKHTHSFDEYMVCVSGEYTAYLNDKAVILKPGDELFIPKGTEQWGKCVAGTRTIHAFGGERIKNDRPTCGCTADRNGTRPVSLGVRSHDTFLISRR